MILTQDAAVAFAEDYALYVSLNKLSTEFGYSSQKTFARVIEAVQKHKPVAVRSVHIGKRRKYNRYDIHTLLT